MLLRILIAIVILGPLPFGATSPWAWTLLGTAVGLLLLAWGVQILLSREAPAIPLGRIWLPTGLFLAVAIWMSLQAASGTPDDWHHPLWRSASDALGYPLPGSVSVTPFDTTSELLRLLAYGGIFWIALQSCRASRDAKAVFLSLALASLAYAAYGLAVEFTGSQTILWFEKEHYRGSLTSTFIYKNAYATYAGLGALCAVGLLLKGMENFAGRDFGKRETVRLAVTWLAESGWLLMTAFAVIVAALILSNSRAGVFVFAVALIALFVAAHAINGPRIPLLRAATLTVLTASVGFFVVTGGTVLDRLARTDIEGDLRTTIYDTTLRALGDAPWRGTGAGSFAEVFSLYRPTTLRGRPLAAHSTHLENALELGLPAAATLTLAVAVPGVICAIGIRRRRRNAVYPCIGVAASLLVGIHAAVDFTLQTPAVAATYALIMGAACAQAWSTRNDEPA